MNWLSRYATPIEALAAMITAGVAVAALIAIPLQIRSAAEVQEAQSARDIFRDFLALSAQNPQFSEPDYCAIKEVPEKLTAYSYYVEYLLYTAEQTTATSADWDDVLDNHLSQHLPFLCEATDWQGDRGPVANLITRLRTENCSQIPRC